MYAHDPEKGHLFAWDREFKYAGRIKTSPGDSLLTSMHGSILLEMAGAYFLAGNKTPAKVVWSNGKDYLTSLLTLGDRGIESKHAGGIHFSDRVALCGPIANDPVAVADYCKTFPINSIYVCPLVSELCVFGLLVSNLCRMKKDYPRRAELFTPCDGELPEAAKEFDPALPGDGYGRMARAVSLGPIVYNQMMTGPGVSPFYGRMLASVPVFKDNVFIIGTDCIETFLRPAPVSMKMYAATCVPVLSPVTDEFRKATKWDKENAVVFVATDFMKGICAFMQFYGVLTHKGFVVSGMVEPSALTGNLPVFRYNKVYATDAVSFLERKHAPA
jgi:hypothetical protein